MLRHKQRSALLLCTRLSKVFRSQSMPVVGTADAPLGHLSIPIPRLSSWSRRSLPASPRSIPRFLKSQIGNMCTVQLGKSLAIFSGWKLSRFNGPRDTLCEKWNPSGKSI